MLIASTVEAEIPPLPPGSSTRWYNNRYGHDCITKADEANITRSVTLSFPSIEYELISRSPEKGLTITVWPP